MARCNCNPTGNPCLSSSEDNLLSYDAGGCLMASYTPEQAFGEASLDTDFDLLVPGDSVWSDTTLSVTLPAAGTYIVQCDVSGQAHAQFVVPTPPAGGSAVVRIFARLYDTTSALALSGSNRLVAGVASNMPGRWANGGSATTSALVTVTGPRVITLQGQRTVTQATGNTVTAVADTVFYGNMTHMRYQRIA